jgi:hypothetical protein
MAMSVASALNLTALTSVVDRLGDLAIAASGTAFRRCSRSASEAAVGLGAGDPDAGFAEADDVGAFVAGGVGEEARVALDAPAAGAVAEDRHFSRESHRGGRGSSPELHRLRAPANAVVLAFQGPAAPAAAIGVVFRH